MCEVTIGNYYTAFLPYWHRSNLFLFPNRAEASPSGISPRTSFFPPCIEQPLEIATSSPNSSPFLPQIKISPTRSAHIYCWPVFVRQAVFIIRQGSSPLVAREGRQRSSKLHPKLHTAQGTEVIILRFIDVLDTFSAYALPSAAVPPVDCKNATNCSK